MEEIDPDQIADANLTDIIQQRIDGIKPILDKLFKAADQPTDVWFKGKDARLLASWILDVQNINMMQEQQLKAIYAELEKEQSKKKRLWKP